MIWVVASVRYSLFSVAFEDGWLTIFFTIADRVQGTVGSAFAGLTGDKAEQEKRQLQHDDGKAAQRGVETDLQKKADA